MAGFVVHSDMRGGRGDVLRVAGALMEGPAIAGRLRRRHWEHRRAARRARLIDMCRHTAVLSLVITCGFRANLKAAMCKDRRMCCVSTLGSLLRGKGL
eukprot:8694746-Alexandrium_andersonii.AAC.1